jgi:hypothetical protein
MAQANQKHLIEDADSRVQRARRYLDRQREAVSTLERAGRDATTAKRLLAISEKAFKIYVADRVRLTKGDSPESKSDSLELFVGSGATYQPRAKSIPRAEKRP